MRQRAEGIVEAIAVERPGAQEVLVRLTAENENADGVAPVGVGEGKPLRHALNLVVLTGRAAVGDRVLLNVTAVEMGLGSGGLDFIVAAPDRNEADTPPPGHIIKLRYTPLQFPVL